MIFKENWDQVDHGLIINDELHDTSLETELTFLDGTSIGCREANVFMTMVQILL